MNQAQIEALFSNVVGMATAYLPKVALAIIVLIIGNMIIGGLSRTLTRVLESRKVDATLTPFISSMFRWGLKLMLLISVASMVGIATTSFVAVIGAATLAIGLSLQGTLGHFAGGVMLLIFRPFKVGDYIIAQGEEGSVVSIDLFVTVLKRADNQKVIIPNGPLAGGLMRNVTANEFRRVDLAVGIGYDDDIDKAFNVLTDMCSKHAKVYKDPGPFVGITEYGDNSINLTVRVHCNTADYWNVFFDLNREIKRTLDQAGISIPYPQRDVHLYNKN